MVKITSKGAANGVTGSQHYVEVGQGADKIEYLIDFGQFQGRDSEKIDPEKSWFESQLEGPQGYWNETNRMPTGIDYSNLDLVFESHAHLDHSGMLGSLPAKEFKGKIVSTPMTLEIATAINGDAAEISTSESNRVNDLRVIERRGWEKEPLYTTENVEQMQEFFDPVQKGEVYTFQKGENKITAVFQNAGHIGGSSSIQFYIEEGDKLTYLYATGDLGKGDHPILKDPEYTPLKPEDVGIVGKKVTANIMLTEGTYGNREHEELDDKNSLANTIIDGYIYAKDTSKRDPVLKEHLQIIKDKIDQMQGEIDQVEGNRNIPAHKKNKIINQIRKDYHHKALLDQAEVCGQLLGIDQEDKYPLDTAHGHILIPVFSVDRLQEIAWDIIKLQKEEKIPEDISIVIDSSLGEEATEIYTRHREEYNNGVIADLKAFGMKHIFDSPNIYLAKNLEGRGSTESVPVDHVKIVLAASGMITGGKSPYYASRIMLDPAGTIITVGYQGEGTPGRDLLEGKDEVFLKFTKYEYLNGEVIDTRVYGDYPVYSARESLRSLYSGHADRDDLDTRVDEYVNFVSDELGLKPDVHLIHGDQDQLEAFESRLVNTYGSDVDVAIQEKNVTYEM